MMWTSGWTIISPLCRYTVHEAESISNVKEVGWGLEGQLWLAQMRQNTEQCGKVQPYFRPFQQVYVAPSFAQALSPKQIGLDGLASKPESVVAQQEVKRSKNCRRLQRTDSSGAQNWTAKFKESPDVELEFSSLAHPQTTNGNNTPTAMLTRWPPQVFWKGQGPGCDKASQHGILDCWLHLLRLNATNNAQ